MSPHKQKGNVGDSVYHILKGEQTCKREKKQWLVKIGDILETTKVLDLVLEGKNIYLPIPAHNIQPGEKASLEKGSQVKHPFVLRRQN